MEIQSGLHKELIDYHKKNNNNNTTKKIYIYHSVVWCGAYSAKHSQFLVAVFHQVCDVMTEGLSQGWVM